MFQDLYTAVTDLPAILQNVIGGAVFALLIYAGQKISRLVAARATKFNTQRRLRYITDEIAKLHLMKGKTFALKSAFLSLLIYRSSRSLVKALIWLTLGFLFGTVLPTFAAAGYVGALYYLFLSLNTLRPVGEVEDIPARLAELHQERKVLKGEA